MSISALATSVPRRAAMPKARWTSALLTTMSTLPPISPASSVTERPLVRSSGTSVTCGRAVMSSRPRQLLPRLGMADPDDLGAGLHQRLDERLADLGLAVGDEDLPELRVAGHLAQHLVVGHVFALLGRKSDQHRGAGAVEARADVDAHRGWRGVGHARRRRHVAVQVDDHRRPGVEAHQAEPPRQPLAVERVVAVVQHGLAEQLAGAGLRRPLQLGRQAAMAGVARRVLHRLAALADLQLEAALGGGRGHAERGAAARERRQVHLPRAQHRVLPARLHQRHRHGDRAHATSRGSPRRCTGTGRR